MVTVSRFIGDPSWGKKKKQAKAAKNGCSSDGSPKGTLEMWKRSRRLAQPVGPPTPNPDQWTEWWSPEEMLPHTALGLVLTSILDAGVPAL